MVESRRSTSAAARSFSERVPRPLWAAAAVGYMGLIWELSSVSRLPRVPILPFAHADKLIHAVEYGGLALLVCFAVGRPRRIAALVAVIVAGGYGAVDEVHQSFVPNRSSTVGDWIADVTGALVVSLAWLYRLRERGDETNRAAPPV